MPWFHGTSRQFERFDVNHSWNECYFGPAVYMSNNYVDALGYSGLSADMQNRINYEMDQAGYEWNNEYVASGKLREEITKRLIHDFHQVLLCRPLIENTLIFSPHSCDSVYDLLCDEMLDDLYSFLSNYYEPSFEGSWYNLYQKCFHIDDSSVTAGEIFAEAVQHIGYDSVKIIDPKYLYGRIVPTHETEHLVVFDPSLVTIQHRIPVEKQNV